MSFLIAVATASPALLNAQTCGGTTLCVGSGQQYATIQAAANVAVAGDTVLVMSGTYAGFASVNGGTATAPITFKANGSSVTVNSAGDGSGDCINIENTNYVIVDGFNVTGCGRAGIRSALTTGVIIRNNTVTNCTEWGIFTGFTPKIQILNNKTSGTVVQHGIYVSNSDVPNDDPVISGNESWGNAGAGIQLNGDCNTLDPNGYSDGVISGALIENNWVHDNQSKGFSLIDVQTSIIQNNLLYNNGSAGAAAGIHLAIESGCNNDPSSNNVIVNNTLVEPNMAAIRITTGIDNVIFNNIAVSSEPIVDETGGPNSIDPASDIETSSTAGLFVNAASNNYQLASGSRAIGAGVASYDGKSAPTTDYLGNARPQPTNRWDSGAYEYVTAAAPANSMAVTPSSGSGSTQTFTFTYTSTSQAQEHFFFNSSLTGDGSCYALYDRPSNTLYIVNNEGTAVSEGATPGSSTVLSNSQCSLPASTASVSTSGNTVTLTVTITFASSFAGSKNIYANIANTSYAFGTWQQIGTWTVPSSTGNTISVTPSSGSGSTQTFTFAYTSTNQAQEHFFFNTSVTGDGACYALYDRPSNTLYIANNLGTAVSEGAKPGSSTVLSNDQCSFPASTASVSTSGNTVTIKLTITFSPSFTGPKNIYANIANTSYVFGAWEQIGTWTP